MSEYLEKKNNNNNSLPHVPHVTHPDAGAVVLDLQELQSAFFHRHLDVGGLGIQTANILEHTVSEHRLEMLHRRLLL